MRILGIMFLILTVGCVSNEGVKVLKEVHKNKEKASKETKEELLEVKKIERRVDINPFLTKEEEERFGSLYYDKELGLRLSAIFYSPGRSRAVINGYILKEGDFIDNKKVKEIKPDRVVLEARKVTYTLGWVSDDIGDKGSNK